MSQVRLLEILRQSTLTGPPFGISGDFTRDGPVLDACDDSDRDILLLEALLSIERLGVRRLLKLLAAAGGPERLWNASDGFLNTHLPEALRQDFFRRRDEDLCSDWLEKHRAVGIQVIPLTSRAYPPMLKEIHDPPPLLFVQGNPDAMNGKTLALVGTREATAYGCGVVEKLVREMAPYGVTIVSGLAAGIDTAAHRAALQYGLPTVAVFGCGLDVIYPVANTGLSREIPLSGGALVSEYPLGRQPDRHTFPQRNRIVAGLSHGVTVIEGDVKSGAMITARLAMEEGRTVFATPGSIFNPGSMGPAHLLKNGATPVTCGEDILIDLKWTAGWTPVHHPPPLPIEAEKEPPPKSAPPPIPPNLSEVEKRVLEAISFDPTPIENLSGTTGLPSAKINETLTLLELDGLIVLLPGAKACRK